MWQAPLFNEDSLKFLSSSAPISPRFIRDSPSTGMLSSRSGKSHRDIEGIANFKDAVTPGSSTYTGTSLAQRGGRFSAPVTPRLPTPVSQGAQQRVGSPPVAVSLSSQPSPRVLGERAGAARASRGPASTTPRISRPSYHPASSATSAGQSDLSVVNHPETIRGGGRRVGGPPARGSVSPMVVQEFGTSVGRSLSSPILGQPPMRCQGILCTEEEAAGRTRAYALLPRSNYGGFCEPCWHRMTAVEEPLLCQGPLCEEEAAAGRARAQAALPLPDYTGFCEPCWHHTQAAEEALLCHGPLCDEKAAVGCARGEAALPFDDWGGFCEPCWHHMRAAEEALLCHDTPTIEAELRSDSSFLNAPASSPPMSQGVFQPNPRRKVPLLLRHDAYTLGPRSSRKKTPSITPRVVASKKDASSAKPVRSSPYNVPPSSAEKLVSSKPRSGKPLPPPEREKGRELPRHSHAQEPRAYLLHRSSQVGHMITAGSSISSITSLHEKLHEPFPDMVSGPDLAEPHADREHDCPGSPAQSTTSSDRSVEHQSR